MDICAPPYPKFIYKLIIDNYLSRLQINKFKKKLNNNYTIIIINMHQHDLEMDYKLETWLINLLEIHRHLLIIRFLIDI